MAQMKQLAVLTDVDFRSCNGRFRHVDAGYERAIEVAKERGVRVPGLTD